MLHLLHDKWRPSLHPVLLMFTVWEHCLPFICDVERYGVSVDGVPCDVRALLVHKIHFPADIGRLWDGWIHPGYSSLQSSHDPRSEYRGGSSGRDLGDVQRVVLLREGLHRPHVPGEGQAFLVRSRHAAGLRGWGGDHVPIGQSGSTISRLLCELQQFLEYQDQGILESRNPFKDGCRVEIKKS